MSAPTPSFSSPESCADPDLTVPPRDTASTGDGRAKRDASPIASPGMSTAVSGASVATGPRGAQLCVGSRDGGFGWLKPDTGTCSVTISLATPTIASKTGASEPSGCTSSNFMALIGRTVLLPVFDDAGSAGNNGCFHIKGFAAFQLTGYNFPGDSYNNNQRTNSCTGDCKGVTGQFVRFVSLDNAFTPGGPDLGAQLVRLTG